MKPSAEPAPSLYRQASALLIAVATAMAVGRVLSVELVNEPSLSQSWPDDPGHPRRPWPAKAPRAMPTFSSNLVACFFMGAAAGGLLPIAYALLTETIPARRYGFETGGFARMRSDVASLPHK